MAQLILGAVGAAVGGPIGGMIGSFLGGMIDQSMAAEQKPPKAGTVAPPTVQFGWPIPRYYGINRAVPWVAWQYELEPVAIEVETKGSSSVTAGYQNFVHVGLLIAERTGPTDIVRLWRNKELVANFRVDADPEDLAAAASSEYFSGFTLYDGDADQLPHPTYEAIVGADAIRYVGRVMLWIDRALCEGTTPPQWEVEIATGPRDYTYATYFTASTNSGFSLVGSIGYGERPQRVPLQTPVRFYAGSDGYFSSQAFATYEEALAYADAHAPGNIETTGTTLIFYEYLGLVSSVADGASINDTHRWGGLVQVHLGGGGQEYRTTQFYVQSLAPSHVFDRALGFETLSNSIDWPIIAVNGMGSANNSIIYGSSQVPWILVNHGQVSGIPTCRGGPPYSVSDYAIPGSDFGGRYCQYGNHVFIGSANAGGGVEGFVYKFAIGSPTASAVSAPLMLIGVSGSFFMDIATDGTTVWVGYNAGIAQLNFSDLTSAGPDLLNPGGGAISGRLLVNSSNQFYQIYDDKVWALDGTTWVEVLNFQGSGIGMNNATHTPGYENETVFITVGDGQGRMLLRTIDGEGTTYNEIIQPEWERAGINDSQMDLAATDGIDLIGSGPLTQSAAVITDRLNLYANATVVVQDKIRTVLLGQNSVGTFLYEEMGVKANANEAEEEPLEVDLDPPVEVAQRYSLSAIDGNADGQTLTVEDNLLVGLSSQVTTVDLPLSITPERAKGVVDTIARSSRTAGRTFKTNVALLDHPEVDVADAVILTGRSGDTYRGRPMRETLADWVRTFEGPLDDLADYIETGETSAGAEASMAIASTGVADILALDGPLLRNADNSDGLYAAPLFGSGISSATLYKSIDGVSFSPAGTTLSVEPTVGRLTSALRGWNGNYVWDMGASFTVEMRAGELSSSTLAAMRLDSTINNALVGSPSRGWAMIRFIEATLTAPDTYTVSKILYALQGSEVVSLTGGLTGDYFVLLNTLGGVVPSNAFNATEAGFVRYLKAVAPGRTVASAQALSFTFNNVRMKPLSPVRLRIIRDSSDNATISAIPRTRLATRWGGSGGSLYPDSEGSASFRFVIYTQGFGSVLRTVDVVGTSLNYTAALQTTDGLTPGDPISVRIYKLGTSGQLGYPLQGTL